MKFGLDFGTTNNSMSVVDDIGNIEIVKLDLVANNSKVIRSALHFARDLSYLVGQEAVDAYLLENRNRQVGVEKTIFTGRWVRPIDTPGCKADFVPESFKITDYGTGRLFLALKSALRATVQGTDIFGRFFHFEQLIGMFLMEIKKRVEKKLNVNIDEVTIGRPVHFSLNKELDDRAQNRLEKALKLAGFNKFKFEFEPIAAVKSYLSKFGKFGQVAMVFDFGGGTLDISIVKSGDIFEVLVTDGIYIGGDLLNSDIMKAKLWDYFGANNTRGDKGLLMPKHLYEGLGSWYSLPNLNTRATFAKIDDLKYKNSNPVALDRLIHLIKFNLGFEIYHAIEKAKKELSKKCESKIVFQDGPINLNVEISRNEFEGIVDFRVEQAKELVMRTMDKAGVEPEQVDVVVRTGGSSLIPVFENMLKKIFGKEKVVLYDTFTSIVAGLNL